jgi:hypothetical protein
MLLRVNQGAIVQFHGEPAARPTQMLKGETRSNTYSHSSRTEEEVCSVMYLGAAWVTPEEPRATE